MFQGNFLTRLSLKPSSFYRGSGPRTKGRNVVTQGLRKPLISLMFCFQNAEVGRSGASQKGFFCFASPRLSADAPPAPLLKSPAGVKFKIKGLDNPVYLQYRCKYAGLCKESPLAKTASGGFKPFPRDSCFRGAADRQNSFGEGDFGRAERRRLFGFATPFGSVRRLIVFKQTFLPARRPPNRLFMRMSRNNPLRRLLPPPPPLSRL